MSTPRLGPARSATIVTRDLDHSIEAWCEHLHQQVDTVESLDPDEAEMLGWPDLAGVRTAWLANALGEPWLQFIESSHSAASEPFQQYGWLSLEIAVQNVDELGESLKNSPFEIIGPPANLAMSDAIRAMQVAGPDGEVLYLTEIKAAVPPFELPFARCAVDRLFIPVMLCPDRAASLAHYEGLSGNPGMSFDTLITVINRAHELPGDTQHPVAVIQLGGECLIEMDQYDGLAGASFAQPIPPSGIAHIEFKLLSQEAEPSISLETGAAGERYLLTSD